MPDCIRHVCPRRHLSPRLLPRGESIDDFRSQITLEGVVLQRLSVPDNRYLKSFTYSVPFSFSLLLYLYSMSKMHFNSKTHFSSQEPVIPPHLHGKLPNPTFNLQNKTSTNPSTVRGIAVAKTEAYAHYNKSYYKMKGTCTARNNASSHDSPYTPWTHILPFRLCDR